LGYLGGITDTTGTAGQIALVGGINLIKGTSVTITSAGIGGLVLGQTYYILASNGGAATAQLTDTYANAYGPYEFAVLLNAADAVSGGTTGALTPALIAEINRRIDMAKNERSKLVALYQYVLYYDGEYSYDGTNQYDGGQA
jgi:hypothetical protein